jgi:N-acetylneuraminic acid mutarotase
MGFGWYNVSPGTVYHNDLWEYDPGANAQWSTNSIQPSITVTNTSLYSLTLTSVAGCSNTGSQSVALSPNPTISLNGNLFSCSGVNNTLSASGAGTYTWSANAGSSNSTSVVVTSSNNETYSVAGTTGSCSVTQTLFVLNITPSLSLTGPSSGCGTVALNTSAIGDYWSQKAALTSITPRHNGIALSIGTKAYVGMGMNTSTTPNTFNDFWEYDPAMNTWTQKANFAGGVRAAAVGFSIGSKGYVGTGFDYSTNTYKNDFWEYDPIANTWTQKANFVSVRSLAVGFGLGSKGYIGTGISNVTPYYYNDFWEYDPSNNTWTQKTNFAGTARCAASAFCIGNLAYVGTGELSASTSTTDIWQYDPSANTWTQKTSYPGSPIKSCASFNIGTKGYITTGMTSSGKSNMTYEYDPLSNTWVNKASFSNGPRAYASGFSIGNKGYITLGLNDSSPYEAKDLFEYNPSLSYVWSTGSTVQTTATSLTGMQLLTVTNVLGCSVSASQSVTVLPSPTLSVSGPTIICEGNAASLNVSGANSFSWSPNSGGSNASSVILSPSITTAYSVSGNNGSCTTIYPFTVSVNPSPTISANSGSICSGGTFTLNPSGAISYSYSSGSNIVSPSVTNTYSITGTSSLGCVSLSSAMVTISVAPLPTLSVNSGSICVGKSFSLTPGGASSYTVLNITGTIVSPTINTSYSVSGTSSVGCVSANFAISTITVNSLPIVTVNSGTACSGQTFTLTPVGAISYTYSGGSANINANITNTYSVIGEDNNGCVSLPAISSLSVFPSPTISISSGSICVGQSFTLLPSGANTFSIEGNNAVVSPTISTTYTVSGTSSVGCISQNYATASVTVNSIPVISVNSGSICFGQSFTIIPNGASTYSFSGGSSIVSPTNTISYSVNGTSTEGCISNTFAIANITVHPLPLISVNSGSICAGESFTIVPNGAISYSYSSGSSVVSPTITSSYFVNGTSIEGCITNTPVVLNVSVFALPSIIVSNYSICSGNSVAILPSGASTYSISGANFTVSPTSTTIYSVNGSSSAGCVSSIATLTVEVMPNPTITVSNATSCAGSSVIIVPSGANSYSINGGSFTVNPIISTAYSVTGTSSSGCQASNPAISYITVNALPNITVNSGSICSGDSFTFVPTGAVSYTFEGGNAIVNPSQSTSYSISGTDLNGCIGSSNGNITVLALPQITISSSDSLICEGESVTLTANGAMSYTWSTNDTLSSLILVPTISTNYSVVAIGVNGCRNQNNYLQLVSSCTGIKTTTIKQIASISIYPNPTAGRFFIELNLKGRIQIIDILGRIVYDNIHDSGSHSFDLQSLNNGLYIVNFINEQHSLSEKLILTK